MPPTATPVPGTGPAPGTGNSIISPGPLTAARLVRAVADATVREAAAAAVIGVTWPTWILGAVTPRLRAPTSTGEVPVLLIHGYGASKSNWLHLRRRLRDAGHRHVHAMGYVPVGGIRQLGSRVTERALRRGVLPGRRALPAERRCPPPPRPRGPAPGPRPWSSSPGPRRRSAGADASPWRRSLTPRPASRQAIC